LEGRFIVNDGRFALLASATGNVLAILAASTILMDPPGSAIRPMHLPLLEIPVAIGTILIAWPFASRAVATRQVRQTALGVAGMLLAASPLLVGFYTFFKLIDFFGYTLKP
jgi:hypothetical protein